MVRSGRRVVRFSLYSETLPGEALQRAIGMGGDVTRSVGDVVQLGPLTVESRSNYWQLDSGLDESDYVESHLDALYERLAPLRPRLRELTQSGCTAMLHVVQYMPNEFQGHGIPIEADWVSMMADLGGSIDIDLYVEDSTGSNLGDEDGAE